MMTVIFLLEQKMHHLQSEQLFPVFPQLLFLQKERSINYKESIFCKISHDKFISWEFERNEQLRIDYNY